MNLHYCYLRSPSDSTSNIQFQLYLRYINKVYGTFDYWKPISLCITELIRLLSPDKKGRHNGFCYSDGTTINQLEEYQVRNGEEVFHIQIILVVIDVKKFVDRSPIVIAWEIRDLINPPQKKLDVCFDSLNCYDNFSIIKWIVTDKIPFNYNATGIN